MAFKWKLNSLLLLILIYLQYSLWIGKNNVFDLKEYEKTVISMQNENASLKLRNEQMFAEIASLQEGNEAIEERARTQLGMIKSGEHFFRIIESETEN